MTFEDSIQAEKATHATLVFERTVPAPIRMFIAVGPDKALQPTALPSLRYDKAAAELGRYEGIPSFAKVIVKRELRT